VLSQPRPQGFQPPCNLDDQGLRQPHVDQRSFQGLQVTLRPRLLALESRAGLRAATLLGAVLPLWPGVLQSPVVLSVVGHGWLLRVVAAPCVRWEKTMTHVLCRFQHVHTL
jgi:hypothetical protein